MKKIKTLLVAFYLLLSFNLFGQTYTSTIIGGYCYKIELTYANDDIRYTLNRMDCDGQIESTIYNLTGISSNSDFTITLPDSGSFWFIPFDGSAAYREHTHTGDCDCHCAVSGGNCKPAESNSKWFCRNAGSCSLDCNFYNIIGGGSGAGLHVRANNVTKTN